MGIKKWKTWTVAFPARDLPAYKSKHNIYRLSSTSNANAATGWRLLLVVYRGKFLFEGAPPLPFPPLSLPPFPSQIPLPSQKAWIRGRPSKFWKSSLLYAYRWASAQSGVIKMVWKFVCGFRSHNVALMLGWWAFKAAWWNVGELDIVIRSKHSVTNSLKRCHSRARYNVETVV